jgi:hypothetical protein
MMFVFVFFVFFYIELTGGFTANCLALPIRDLPHMHLTVKSTWYIFISEYGF